MTKEDKDMADLSHVLLDRDAIKDVRYHFALAVDTRDWALFETLFTDEVDVDLPALGGPRRTMPKAELAAIFRHTFRRPAAENPTQQLYGNLLVEVDGDAATCDSYLVGYHHIPGFEGGDDATLRARYTDHLTRTPDGWRIAATAIHVFSVTGNPQILA